MVRRAYVWIAQIGVFAISGLAAFLLRFDFSLPARYRAQLLFAIPIWIVVKTVAYRLAKLDRRLGRYVSVNDFGRIASGNVIASAASAVLIILIAPPGFPRSIFALDLITCFLITSGLRVITRIASNANSRAHSAFRAARRALIYGAGDAGIILLREIRNNPRLAYDVLGFLDDHPAKQDTRIAGLPVLGYGDTVGVYVSKYGIEIVLIAIPSATGAEMTRILALCHAANVECKTVPGLSEIIEKDGLLGQIRNVAVEDLLGRSPVHLEESLIRSTIQGKVVLVTGAAGSVGSELCRQIARFHPAAIVGFEIAESPLFEIDREMRGRFPDVRFYAEVGSIQNRLRLEEVMCRHRPSMIYHAAAYKHVPLMEEHVFEAIENNVFGTLNVAQCAAQYGVESFVMISSDKAIRPTNVMGATKRIAELLLLFLQNGGTQFIAVRFGNVLGSSGSVIPIFKKQIASGGPVTVTHPEMRRFFMTITEACQLVLQASAIGKGGQICILDMGQPVKIVDLARNLILLSGFIPDEDIKIEFTGVRPGEKLHEELSTLLEDTIPTDHEKVRIYVGKGIPNEYISSWLESLRKICEHRDLGRLITALKGMVPDYDPSPDLLKRAFEFQDLHIPLLASRDSGYLSPTNMLSN